MNNRALSAAAALLAACLVWAWAFGWFEGKQYSEDPVVAELEKERDAAFADIDRMSRDQLREQRQAFEKKASGLTPEQRMALFESSMPFIVPMAAKRFETEYDKFMAMSPEEQRRELDERIDQMEARAASGNGPGGDGRRGGPPNMDPKRAEAIRKKMLDWTTPEQRAKFENGIQIMNDRRKERGLPPLQRPGLF